MFCNFGAACYSFCFRSVEVDLESYKIDKSQPKWYHYFLCGYRGMLEHIGVSGSIGFDVLLDGTIPRSAGLSSSSALVCCAALVTMHIYDKQISRVCSHLRCFMSLDVYGHLSVIITFSV